MERGGGGGGLKVIYIAATSILSAMLRVMVGKVAVGSKDAECIRSGSGHLALIQ